MSHRSTHDCEKPELVRNQFILAGSSNMNPEIYYTYPDSPKTTGLKSCLKTKGRPRSEALVQFSSSHQPITRQNDQRETLVSRNGILHMGHSCEVLPPAEFSRSEKSREARVRRHDSIIVKKASATQREATASHREARCSQREAPVTHREAPPCHREAPPSHREAHPCHREVLPSYREAPPSRIETHRSNREAPASHREVPPTHRGAPPSYREPLHSQREAPPSHREAPSSHREAPPTHREAHPSYQENIDEHFEIDYTTNPEDGPELQSSSKTSETVHNREIVAETSRNPSLAVFTGGNTSGDRGLGNDISFDRGYYKIFPECSLFTEDAECILNSNELLNIDKSGADSCIDKDVKRSIVSNLEIKVNNGTVKPAVSCMVTPADAVIMGPVDTCSEVQKRLGLRGLLNGPEVNASRDGSLQKWSLDEYFTKLQLRLNSISKEEPDSKYLTNGRSLRLDVCETIENMGTRTGKMFMEHSKPILICEPPQQIKLTRDSKRLSLVLRPSDIKRPGVEPRSTDTEAPAVENRFKQINLHPTSPKCSSELGTRSRIDHHVYECYIAGILQSSMKSERFQGLQRLYSTLESISTIEASMMTSSLSLPHCKRIPTNQLQNKLTRSQSFSDLSLFGRRHNIPSSCDENSTSLPNNNCSFKWRDHSNNDNNASFAVGSESRVSCGVSTEILRAARTNPDKCVLLRDLYADLDTFMKDRNIICNKKIILGSKFPPQDCLSKREVPLIQLRQKIDKKAIDVNMRTSKCDNKKTELFDRNHSFDKLFAKYWRLEKVAESRSVSCARQQARNQSARTGTYQALAVQASKQAKERSLHGYFIDENINRYEEYVRRRKNRTISEDDISVDLDSQDEVHDLLIRRRGRRVQRMERSSSLALASSKLKLETGMTKPNLTEKNCTRIEFSRSILTGNDVTSELFCKTISPFQMPKHEQSYSKRYIDCDSAKEDDTMTAVECDICANSQKHSFENSIQCSQKGLPRKLNNSIESASTSVLTSLNQSYTFPQNSSRYLNHAHCDNEIENNTVSVNQNMFSRSEPLNVHLSEDNKRDLHSSELRTKIEHQENIRSRNRDHLRRNSRPMHGTVKHVLSIFSKSQGIVQCQNTICNQGKKVGYSYDVVGPNPNAADLICFDGVTVNNHDNVPLNKQVGGSMNHRDGSPRNPTVRAPEKHQDRGQRDPKEDKATMNYHDVGTRNPKNRAPVDHQNKLPRNPKEDRAIMNHQDGGTRNPKDRAPVDHQNGGSGNPKGGGPVNDQHDGPVNLYDCAVGQGGNLPHLEAKCDQLISYETGPYSNKKDWKISRLLDVSPSNISATSCVVKNAGDSMPHSQNCDSDVSYSDQNSEQSQCDSKHIDLNKLDKVQLNFNLVELLKKKTLIIADSVLPENNAFNEKNLSKSSTKVNFFTQKKKEAGDACAKLGKLNCCVSDNPMQGFMSQPFMSQDEFLDHLFTKAGICGITATSASLLNNSHASDTCSNNALVNISNANRSSYCVYATGTNTSTSTTSALYTPLENTGNNSSSTLHASLVDKSRIYRHAVVDEPLLIHRHGKEVATVYIERNEIMLSPAASKMQAMAIDVRADQYQTNTDNCDAMQNGSLDWRTNINTTISPVTYVPAKLAEPKLGTLAKPNITDESQFHFIPDQNALAILDFRQFDVQNKNVCALQNDNCMPTIVQSGRHPSNEGFPKSAHTYKPTVHPLGKAKPLPRTSVTVARGNESKIRASDLLKSLVDIGSEWKHNKQKMTGQSTLHTAQTGDVRLTEHWCAYIDDVPVSSENLSDFSGLSLNHSFTGQLTI